MLSSDFYFIIFLATILIIRLFLFWRPIPGPTIKGFRTHHYMWGLVLVVISFFFKNLFIYSVGLGLFIDELSYLIIGGKTHKDNYSSKSLIGTLLFVIIIFVFRKRIFGLI